MKKYLMTLAAVLCCAMTTTLFTACGDDEEKKSNGYSYYVSFDVLNSIYYQSEVTTLQSALNQAVGYDGTIMKAYTSSQDDAMKNACEAVRKQYANSIRSTYIRFYLVRIIVDTDANKTEEAIATYEFGAAVNNPYVTYSYASNADDVTKELVAQKDSLGDEVYKASRRTVIALSTAFKNFFAKNNGPFPATDANDQAVKYYCDSIMNAHADDTLAVSVTFAAYKKAFPDGDRNEIWRKTKQSNN
jgi:hypothetical protein